MLDERSCEKGGWKKWLKIILLSVVAIVLTFLLTKTFYFNRPKLSPAQVAISYLQAEQSPDLPADSTTLRAGRNLAEEKLFPDFEKVEILSEKYLIISRLNWI